MATYLRWIEVYPPNNFAGEECLSHIATVFSYYANKAIRTDKLKKLMINFMFADENNDN
jgi:hypothetical protein